MILELVALYTVMAVTIAISMGKDANSDESATLAIVTAVFWPLGIVVMTTSNIAHAKRMT